MNDAAQPFKDPAPRHGVEAVHHIGRESLPACCPPPGISVWNLHPRVYLPVLESGEVTCAYCGTRYVLKDPVPGGARPSFPDPDIEKACDRHRERARRDFRGIPCEPRLAA